MITSVKPHKPHIIIEKGSSVKKDNILFILEQNLYIELQDDLIFLIQEIKFGQFFFISIDDNNNLTEFFDFSHLVFDNSVYDLCGVAILLSDNIYIHSAYTSKPHIEGWSHNITMKFKFN